MILSMVVFHVLSCLFYIYTSIVSCLLVYILSSMCLSFYFCLPLDSSWLLFVCSLFQ